MIQKLLRDKASSKPYLSSQNKKYAKTKQNVYAHVEHTRQYAKPFNIRNFQQQYYKSIYLGIMSSS